MSDEEQPPIVVEETRDEEDEEEDQEDAITRHWKASPFAVGKVPRTWAEEAATMRWGDDLDDTTCCSALFCSKLGAGRVGNMAVLAQSHGDKPRIYCVVGPYWCFTLMCTLPLISGVSCFVGSKIWDHDSGGLLIAWGVCTGLLYFSLFMVACSNPGIFYRHDRPRRRDWIWNDQALTYRPRSAKYDTDVAVVIEEFDHVCPWTGTAIGKRNMIWFNLFVLMIAVCLCLDVLLIVLA